MITDLIGLGNAIRYSKEFGMTVGTGQEQLKDRDMLKGLIRDIERYEGALGIMTLFNIKQYAFDKLSARYWWEYHGPTEELLGSPPESPRTSHRRATFPVAYVPQTQPFPYTAPLPLAAPPKRQSGAAPSTPEAEMVAGTPTSTANDDDSEWQEVGVRTVYYGGSSSSHTGSAPETN